LRVAKLFLSVALAAAASGAVASPALGAVPDPERNSTARAGWHWWRNVSEDKLNSLRKQYGERIVDIEVERTSPIRFAAALVRNKGTYKRNWSWWFNRTEAGVKAKVKELDSRIIDLEPYTVNGQRRFAFVLVKNTGDAKKGWWWNFDLTPSQVTDGINDHKVRLVDLDTYTVNGKRRYSYVGIKNTGVDKTGWWWYYNVSPAFVQQKADAHGARLIDIERPSPGKLTVVMVKNSGKFTLHAAGYSEDALNKLTWSNGVRITDVESYTNNGKRRFAAVTIDDTDSDSARLRSLIRSSPWGGYHAPTSGKDYKGTGFFGAFSKRVGGRTYVDLASTRQYNPSSVLKLVPHLFIMDLFDQNKANLDQQHTVPWHSKPGKPDEIMCPADTGPFDEHDQSLRETLTEALHDSNNRAHESLLNKYTPEAINPRIHQLGLVNTNIYYGCKHEGKPDWTSNRTTLREMGLLFEGVDLKTFFPNHYQQTRGEFYGIMHTWPKDWFKPIVANEAAKQGKSASVDAFMNRIAFKGKGGGYNSCSSATLCIGQRSFSYWVTFPFKVPVGNRVGIEDRAYVGGYFIDPFEMPCNPDDAATSSDPDCKDWAKKDSPNNSLAAAEGQRVPIREALKTWPEDSIPVR
jgi:beta-lactamase family protein/polyglycine hydrolase-like protein